MSLKNRVAMRVAKRCAMPRIDLCLAALLGAFLLVGCATPPKEKITPPAAPPSALSDKARTEQQQAILKIRDQALRQLHKLKPGTRAEIQTAAGYGVFDVNGLNAVLVDAHGRGVMMEKATGRAVYMQLARTDVRPGKPMLPYRQVLIFRSPQKLQQFMSAASTVDVARDPDVKVYRLNEKGVAVQADLGARYFRDPDLNVGAPIPPAANQAMPKPLKGR